MGFHNPVFWINSRTWQTYVEPWGKTLTSNSIILDLLQALLQQEILRTYSSKVPSEKTTNASAARQLLYRGRQHTGPGPSPGGGRARLSEVGPGSASLGGLGSQATAPGRGEGRPARPPGASRVSGRRGQGASSALGTCVRGPAPPRRRLHSGYKGPRRLAWARPDTPRRPPAPPSPPSGSRSGPARASRASATRACGRRWRLRGLPRRRPTYPRRRWPPPWKMCRNSPDFWTRTLT